MYSQVSVSHFCWNDWETRYPAEVVENEPEVHYGKFATRGEAQDCVYVGSEEMPTTVNVVRHNQYYYVVDGVGWSR
jgi:hypothetical protein